MVLILKAIQAIIATETGSLVADEQPGTIKIIPIVWPRYLG
jgi:hypothetical protein